MDLTNDGDALASAVVGRTNGDLQQALSILEEATNTIMKAAQQSEQPVMAAEGKPIPSGTEGAGLRALPDEVVERMGFVKAADGRAMMRNMIMNSLSKKPEEKKMAYGGKMEKMSYGGDVKKMMGGGQMMKYADGGEMEEYNMGGEIIPFV